MAEPIDGGVNPYIALQQQAEDTISTVDPGLLDRFWTNFEAAKRYNTVLGAVRDASTPSRQKDRQRFDRTYETYPEWDGLAEGAAALGGQIAGTAMSPENFIPVGLGDKILVAGKAGLTGLWARVFSGAVDAAAANAVADAAIQGVEISAGFRDQFDPVQYGASVLLGAGIGGAGGAVGKVVGDRLAGDAARVEPATSTAGPAPAAASEPNPYAALQDAVEPGGVEPRSVLAEPVSPVASPVIPAETIGETLSIEAAKNRNVWIEPSQVDRVAASQYPVGKVPRKPQSLLNFLAEKGGIQDDAGDLAAIGVAKKFIPGRGALVRETGVNLDRAREAAAEAGYFNALYGNADEAASKSTVRDLLDLIDQEHRGQPVFSMADGERQKALTEYESALAAREDYKRFLSDMADTLNELDIGITVDDGVLARSAEIMINERLSPLDAFDRAVIEDEARLEAMFSATKEAPDAVSSGKDIPFFDDAGSAAARSDVGAARQGRAAGGRGRDAAGGTQPQDTGRDASQGRASDGSLEQTIIDEAQASRSNDEFLMAQPSAGMRAQRVRGQPTAVQASVRIQRVRETAETLAKALDVAATRQGRITGGKRVLGTFNTKSGVVRVRSLDDFDVLTHEYGHHIDQKIPAVKAFIKANSAELAKLDYDPQAGRDFEGFAEFFRLYLTNRAYVSANMPALEASFRTVLDGNPEIRAAIDAATEAWDAFLSAPSSVAVRSTIVSAKKDGWIGTAAKELRKSGLGGTIAEVLQRIYTFAFDDLNPISRAVGYLQAVHFNNKGAMLDLPVTRDPYKLARMSRGAYSAGHMDIMYGVAPYGSTHPASPSLRDAIIEATAKPNGMSRWDEEKVAEFASYLWSRRAAGEWERYRAGQIPNPPDKLTEADHIENIATMEKANPAFASAAEKVYGFSRALWKKKLDAGLIDQATHDEGLLIKDYVPGLRDFSSDTDMKVPPGPSKGKTAKGGFARRFKGSKRDVINPIESLAADAYETSMAIARNDVVKALHRLALTAGPGGGAIAEIIPAKEMRGTMIDPLEAVENAAKAAGLAKADIVVLRDALESAIGSEKAAVFRPAIINDKGEPIAFFRDGGQLKALRLADGEFGLDMYRAITAMSPVEKNFWLELVAVPARILRAGITTSFEFIGANFVRDQAMAAVYYGKPLQRVGATLNGGLDEMMGRDIARSYSRVYGISGGSETASLSKAMADRDLMALRRKGWVAQRFTSWRGVIEAAEISETATRLGLYRTFKEEAMKRGLSENEALLEASWRARDYMDFDRRGSGMAGLARVIPFLNVALQGLDKSARHMIAPLAKKALGVPLSAADERAASLATKTWARLAVLTTAGTALYAQQSRHEDYNEISETTRATHWMVKAGEKWVAIPKPYEFGVVLNLGEAMFDAMVENDPAAAGRWLDSLSTTLTPPSLLEGNPAVKAYFEVKSNTNFFTGAPIVPDQLRGLEPWLQYTERTSAFAKQLGAAFDVSPAVADHLLVSFFGGWGRNLLSLYDLAQPDAPGFAWDDAPISRRFIKDAAKGSQSGTMFWQLMGQTEGRLEGKAKTWDALASSGRGAEAADFYAGLDDIEKAYVAISTAKTEVRRAHPMIRARGAVQAIGAVRREMAGGALTDADGVPIAVTSAERTAADDVLSSLAMAIMRNSMMTTGVAGWAQRKPIDEEGFYRELEAINPQILARLADGYVGKRVWRADAVNAVWPELRDRLLAEGGAAEFGDLVTTVKSEGYALDGIKRKPPARPVLTPSPDE